MKQEISLTRVARPAALMSLMFFACIASVRAQIAQNGVYKLEQAVIASGGGTSNDIAGNVFSLTGTIGQAIAGTTSHLRTVSQNHSQRILPDCVSQESVRKFGAVAD